MRTLAIETSGATGSVAVVDGDRLIAETALPGQRRSTQTLAPAMRALLEQAAWKPRDVELLAVSIGPGSFTGLRLGVATVKLFAYATGAAVRGVDTLRAIAEQVDGATSVEVVLDAGRGELLSGHFRFATGGSPLPVGETRLIAVADWLRQEHAGVTLAGSGLNLVVDRLPLGTQIAPRELWTPRAATIARLAQEDVKLGRVDNAWSLVPVYYRRSAAEEVWEAKSQRGQNLE